MANLYCMYWVPGSCGDLLQQVLSMHADWYTGSHFSLDHNGRWQRQVDKDFRQAYPAESNQWLWRSWTTQELDSLLLLPAAQVAIGTHSIDELRKIKQHLGSKVTTVGVTYNKNMYPAVLKNFCAKVGEADPKLNSIYSKAQPELYQKLKQNNLFGPKLLKDLLKSGNLIPKQQLDEFDVAVDLEKILLGDLGWANQWLTQQSAEHVANWTVLQDPLYSTAIVANQHYSKCLGLNSQATKLDSNPINLNTYHHTLIHHHYPQAARFKTHTEFKYFTENTDL